MLLALRTSTLGGRSPCRWLPELRHNDSRDKKSGRRVGCRLLAASCCLSRALTLRRRLPLRREGGGRSLRERKKKQEKETRHPISNREKKSILTLKCVRFPTCLRRHQIRQEAGLEDISQSERRADLRCVGISKHTVSQQRIVPHLFYFIVAASRSAKISYCRVKLTGAGLEVCI